MTIVRVPVLLSFFATLTAGVMAYGVDPQWAQQSWGLDVIMLTRRLQWPLATLSILLCIALIALVISGKRRAWWLIGLLPVLTLFVHRYLTAPINRWAVADEPALVAAAEATFIRDDDYVVGVVFNEEAYAYPFACLYQSPVIVQSDRADRMLLMWSPRANAATALMIERELKARNLDIVADPAGAFLIYNTRSGQFISALTGMTPAHQTPASMKSRIAVTKTTWRRWKMSHPQTRAMLPVSGSYRGPTRPLLRDDLEPVVLVGGDAPALLSAEMITSEPMSFSADGRPVVVFRDPTGRVVAFDRHVENDLIPTFKRNTESRRKEAYLIDSDTGAGWSAAGVAVDGPKEFRGKRLTPVVVQDQLDPAAVQFWFSCR